MSRNSTVLSLVGKALLLGKALWCYYLVITHRYSPASSPGRPWHKNSSDEGRGTKLPSR
ncbi:hypothetical protein B0H12DRAFT_1155204 [Mycena haematopus]|nr:hypothetical protein B0H12DRAFT_1155204 [Mycena haematopus]